MTDAEILELAKQHGDMTIDNKRRIDYCFDDCGILVFVEVVANKTRDECADLCDALVLHTGSYCAVTIRSMTE